MSSILPGPRAAFDLVENSVHGLEDLNSDMAHLINTHQVNQHTLLELQNKIKSDQNEWRDLKNRFIKDYLTPEELMVSGLVNEKIRRLDEFQRALNNLWRHV